MSKITPFLWFDHQAEEAATFYTSLFDGSTVGDVQRYGPEGPGGEGEVMIVNFSLAGAEFTALNGGPMFSFTEAISLAVDCEDQAEVDRLWDALLSGGGEPSQCGWLKDRFGLSWQIVPKALGELTSGPDAAKTSAVMQAMLGMVKIDVAGLQAAYDQG